jgi:vacuolar-type H+-ATPase subunit D/Vma8
MNIKEMKSKRDALHEELHALLAEYKPKEAKIRDQIKELQQELYRREMTPVLQKLEFDIAEGNLDGEALEKAKLKAAQIKSVI